MARLNRLSCVLDLSLVSFRSSPLHLSFSCYNSFLLLPLAPLRVAATGFLTENFNDRPTFPRPIYGHYGISYGNVKHRDKYASDSLCKDQQRCNETTGRYQIIRIYKIGLVWQKAPYKSTYANINLLTDFAKAISVTILYCYIQVS